MDENQEPGVLKAITWEAPEHHHVEKSPEWYMVVAIITAAASFAAFMVGNFLFAFFLLLSGIVVSAIGLRAPAIIPYGVTARGVRVDDQLYPFSSLESYFIDEEDPKGPQLLLKAERLTMPLIVVPLPEEEVDEIEDLIAGRLPEEHLEEPLITKIMEYFGF